jgi:hypothetical protein
MFVIYCENHTEHVNTLYLRTETQESRASNDWLSMNNELEPILKEAVVA